MRIITSSDAFHQYDNDVERDIDNGELPEPIKRYYKEEYDEIGKIKEIKGILEVLIKQKEIKRGN